MSNTRASAVYGDRDLRQQIRLMMPAGVFTRQPRRILYAPLLGALIFVCSAIIALVPLPWLTRFLLSIMIGNFYAMLMFFAHEVGHGAVVRARFIQNLVLYLGTAIFCMSPHLWREWHNRTHHPFANDPARDPDTFGTLARFRAATSVQRFILKFSPGSGHSLSLLYLPTFFTLHSQSVVWYQSRGQPSFQKLSRVRAGADSLGMAVSWGLVAVWLGRVQSVNIIFIPMIVANCMVLSYVVDKSHAS